MLLKCLFIKRLDHAPNVFPELLTAWDEESEVSANEINKMLLSDEPIKGKVVS